MLDDNHVCVALKYFQIITMGNSVPIKQLLCSLAVDLQLLCSLVYLQTQYIFCVCRYTYSECFQKGGVRNHAMFFSQYVLVFIHIVVSID